MTGRETLAIYARLRGLPARTVPLEAERLLQQMGLAKLADRRCGTYSGGNQRRLSVAVALIGQDSGVVCLDEPSTGVDVGKASWAACPRHPRCCHCAALQRAGARRSLWAVIQDEQHAGKTVVLTSHR